MSVFCNSLVIVTGTNRGYGVELSKAVARNLSGNSLLILSARNEVGLLETTKSVKELITEDSVKVMNILCDLSNQEDVSGFMAKCVQNIDVSKFDNFMFLHNAGSLGNVEIKLKEQTDAKTINDFFAFNVTNVLLLTNQFLKKFQNQDAKCFLINISSLCAIKAIAMMGPYCTAKAARDMMFKVFAEENPQVRVLNWAPGPMQTAMTTKMKNCGDDKIAGMFKSMEYVPLNSSAEKLMAVLKENKFTSGDHIDYFDV